MKNNLYVLLCVFALLDVCICVEGCNAMNNSGVDIVHNISECRWKSQCNTFAIRETDNEKIECKCFDLGDIARETKCTSTCESTDEYTCGRKGRNYFSVYTVENATDANISVADADKSWAKAGKTCFERNGYPAAFRHIDSSKISEGQLNLFQWTGVIRMSSLLRFDDGHLTSTSKRMEMTTRDKAEGVEPQIPITEISAGVSTAVVLVILVVIIIILWKRGGLRRFGGDTKTPPNNETPMQYLDTEYTEPQALDHPKAYPNQGYSMTEELPMSSKHITSGKPQILDEYEDVNDVSNTKINPQGIQLNIGNVHNNISRDLEEYDHLNHSGIPDHAISQPINDYDSATAAIGENQKDTYNHLNERPKQRRITENDYGVQDKNETKDIYNQLNERPEQKHMMENIYGMQEKNETENEYDITVERPVTFKDMSEKASGVNYDKVNKNW
ncbi:hypothetical protein MAR_001532 [Mya arenaria]|uniref:WSC domain-containing protein n=1 Tax=Mya arenaria TaxID=6604 RepID=A0ABY7FEA9_MYAAR|nr:hypothetical protein MAR_001532 [Mya arenaria]